jgi:hypothetical protein
MATFIQLGCTIFRINTMGRRQLRHITVYYFSNLTTGFIAIVATGAPTRNTKQLSIRFPLIIKLFYQSKTSALWNCQFVAS